jgi:hypothetical protein
MYKNLGIHWASSIPAFLSLICLPFPFLLYKYGAIIRLKCKYSAEAAAILEELRQEDDILDESADDEKMDGNEGGHGKQLEKVQTGATDRSRRLERVATEASRSNMGYIA